MKQLKLLACFVMLTTLSRAQYFQGKYAQDPALGGIGINGMCTSFTGSGHLLGGLMIQNQSPPPPCPYAAFNWGLLITRTDNAGGVTAPGTFNSTYLFQDAGGNQIRLTSAQVIEYTDGTGYGAIFSYYLYIPPPPGPCAPPPLTSQGVGFARLNTNGVVTAVAGFPMPSSGNSIYVNDIRESSSSAGDIYATGEWIGSEGTTFWALRVQQNGTLVWGNVYDNNGEKAYGIMENPYNSNEVVIAGASPVSTGGVLDGLFMTVDALTGTPLIVNQVRGGNSAYFRSVNASNDPMGMGFILSGTADGQAWVLKTDPVGNPLWGGRYLPSVHSSTYIEAFDAKGRLNTSGNYEYYVTGPCSDDAYIFKIDQTGNPSGINAMFFYNVGAEETTKRVDVNTSGTDDGVSAYGVVEWPSAQTEGYIVKSYFNGVTSCDGSFDNLNRSSLVWDVIPSSMNATPILSQTLLLKSRITNSSNVLCNSSSIPGGDNSRMATAIGIATESADAGRPAVFPNPCNTALNPVALNFTSEKAEQANITVRNLLGQTVYRQNNAVVPGDNTLKLDLSGSALNSGVYEVNIQTSTGTHTCRLVADNTK